MELLVDKPGGTVYPEPGPNMMWNTKYGMMSGGGYGPMMGPGRGMMGPNGGGMMGGSSASASARGPRGNTAARMDVSPEQARKIAEAYLSRVSPSTETEKPERFYGYYTVDTEKDGKAVGMLSVNGYSGEVWYHSWHGPFIAKQEGTRALIHPSAWNRNSREFRYEILNTRARNFRDRNFSAPTISIQVLRGPSRLQGLRSSPRLTTERGAPVDSGMPAHRLRPDNRYLFVRPDSGKMHHQVVERGYEEALKT
jgi:hypothetical protein